MTERRRLINPTVHVASSLHDADGLLLNEDGEVQGWKDLSRHVGTVTINQAAHEIDPDQKRRIAGLESLAQAETRLVRIGDVLLRIGRRIRHPFG